METSPPAREMSALPLRNAEGQKTKSCLKNVRLPDFATTVRKGHANLDIFSPVNQNGSFEFDRVLKSGLVYKRTRKTKQWKRCFLVLRPNLLSMYKTSSEERLHKQINLADLNAVAYLKDPKGRRNHMFGLFLPSRNYHFEADSDRDAREWIELIRKEARIDEEEEMLMNSPGMEHHGEEVVGHLLSSGDDREATEQERIGSSSPEPQSSSQPIAAAANPRRLETTEPSTINLTYSGPEHASFSDLSDAGFSQSLNATSRSNAKWQAPLRTNSAPTSGAAVKSVEPGIIRNSSHKSESNMEPNERVIWHGYLLCLKSKGGVRQWKKLWSVLRAKNLAFYKNEEEYSATLLLPLSSIISAVEIDPVSRSKSHCMQIISEDKSYRFCAPSEDALAKWLGALKSQLAKKREQSQKK